MFNIHCTTRR